MEGTDLRIARPTATENSDENLFASLGITDYSWEYMPARPEFVGGQLHMRSRDVLKFGLLYLNDGEWNGKRLAQPY